MIQDLYSTNTAETFFTSEVETFVEALRRVEPKETNFITGFGYVFGLPMEKPTGQSSSGQYF